MLFVLAVLLLQSVAPHTVLARSAVRAVRFELSPSLRGDPVVGLALDDAIRLLRRAFPETDVRMGDTPSDVQIEVRVRLMGEARSVPRPTAEAFTPALDLSYAWRSASEGGRIVLTLTAHSPNGIRCGLYGLLQEKLGFRFLHPRQTIIPRLVAWPLPPVFSWKGEPRFPAQGFHVHSLHPVELTEPLHDPGMPGAFDEVREYIDWLARNQQDLFQFFLLRGVDRARWPEHARRIVEYAHQRGILSGVEISLSMLQQNAFQAVKLASLRSYERQVDDSFVWLMQAGWDFVTLDLTMGEYQPDLGALLPGLRDHAVRELTERYGVRVMLATHVIRPEHAWSEWPPDRRAGILIHTVMCYAIDDRVAPVYGNKDQRHMLALAAREKGRREVWYWPESAYWVAFDSSVPLLLLPYLDARWRDMATMDRFGADGHLTFTSGWEWGYWLVDWSIARWAWRYRDNDRVVASGPLDRLRDLFPDARYQRLWDEAFALQIEYLKVRELMPFLAAVDPSAELFWPFDPPFAPRMPFTYRWLLQNATDDEIAGVLSGPVAGLQEYAERMHGIMWSMRKLEPDRPVLAIAAELIDALDVTALRAEHRALTLQGLIAAREGRHRGRDTRDTMEEYLGRAAAVRGRALGIVRERERTYRYPVEWIARKRAGSTSYGFGYLYPVSDLHFWRREEEQVRQRRFDAFFMNIWDFYRISGVGGLLW